MGDKRSKRSKRNNATKPKRTVAQENRAPSPPPPPERGGMERMPSNAPTMAIAPSDYEHIFHEAMPASSPVVAQPPQFTTMQRHDSAGGQMSPQAQQTHRSPPAGLLQGTGTPPAPIRLNRGIPELEAYTVNTNRQQQGRQQYAAEVLATPDGYTLLGHAPDVSNTRKVALPPHIVRAGNQFSRAALSRISRYLATRAEPNYR